MPRSPFVNVVLFGVMAATCCCSSAYGQRRGDVPPQQGGESQFERGRPHEVLDTAGSVIGVFDKLALWDRRTRNHQVSNRTEVAVAQYMADNHLDHTKVRINQYAPGDEWRRLTQNKEVGAGWRYTVGALTTLGYTILPGRLLGRDSYNPYTDTVNIYSDLPPLAMEQAAHAKNVRSRNHPGTYATLTALPLVNLFPEKIAKDDVLAYVDVTGNAHARRETNDVLTPQYGGEVGGQVGQVLTGVELIPRLAGAAVGHAVKGARGDQAEQRRQERQHVHEQARLTDRAVQQASASVIVDDAQPAPNVQQLRR